MWVKQPRDSILAPFSPQQNYAVNSLTSQGLEHKPEASREFLQYDMDLQVPEGTDFFRSAVADMWQEGAGHTEVR